MSFCSTFNMILWICFIAGFVDSKSESGESLETVGDPYSVRQISTQKGSTGKSLWNVLETLKQVESRGIRAIDRRQFLNTHNALRAIHQDTPPLQWDKTLELRAQAWAENLASRDALEHSTGGTQYRVYSGENLYWGSGESVTAARAVVAFYSEEYRFNYDYSLGRGDGVTGHFTQLVWASSVKLGCGIVKNGNTFVVCQYSPPGNWLFQYTTNVLPPKEGLDPKTEAQKLL